MGVNEGVTASVNTALTVLIFTIIGILLIALAFSAYAVAIRIVKTRRERLRERLREEWEPPVLAAIVDPSKVDDVHAHVAAEHRMLFVQFVLEYARRVRGDERQTLRRLVEPYLPAIAERARHRRAEIRTRAVQTLGTLGLPKYEKEVLAGLDDPSPLVSMIAARYLARPEFPQYGSALMDHLERFESWNRRFLASMLATMGAEVTPILRDRLVDETQPPWLRSVYAEALRMQRDARAADPAVQALRSVQHRDLAASLLRLLATVGRPEHVEIARDLSEADDEIIRAQALHAVGVLGDEDELPLLLAGMDDASPWAAMHAARGVRDAGGTELLREMAEAGHPKADLAGQVLFEERER